MVVIVVGLKELIFMVQIQRNVLPSLLGVIKLFVGTFIVKRMKNVVLIN